MLAGLSQLAKDPFVSLDHFDQFENNSGLVDWRIEPRRQTSRERKTPSWLITTYEIMRQVDRGV